MKLFENKLFNPLLLLLFLLSLIVFYLHGSKLGLQPNEIVLTIISAIFMLLATLIAVSLPLYGAFKSDQEKRSHERETNLKRKKKELKRIYISVARYVGNELMENKIRIEDVRKVNKVTLDKMNKQQPILDDFNKKMVLTSIWRAAAEDLLVGIEEEQHRSMIMSGILTKVPDDKMSEAIQEAYYKISILKLRLRRMVIFFREILLPPPNIPKDFIQGQLDTKVLDSISAVEKNLDAVLKHIEIARKAINKLIKLYGKEVKVAYF